VVLAGHGDVWPRIVENVKNLDVWGCRIRVLNQSGQIILLIGVESACRSSWRPVGSPSAGPGFVELF